VLLCLENDAVPVLEEAANAVVVILGETIELVDDCVFTAEDLDLVALCCSAPLCSADGGLVESEGIAAADGFPSEAALGKTDLASLLAEVEEDVIDALAR
jgi:hypothetical protein